MKDGSILHISGGNRQIIKAEGQGHVRSLIVHSRNLPIIPIQQICTPDLAAGLISVKKKGRASWQQRQLVLISSYCWDINLNEIPKDLKLAVEYAKSRNLDYQIHMDLNCHCTLFGSRDQNERGNLLEEFMAMHGIVVS